MSNNANFESGVEYRGRVEISAPSYLYSEADVRQELEGVGWTSVYVWKDAEQLPQDWPAQAKGDSTGFGHSQVWIDGAWSRESGPQPASGNKWKLLDYWLYRRPSATPAPGQEQPEQPVEPQQPESVGKPSGMSGFSWLLLLGVTGGAAWWMHKKKRWF